MQIAIGITVTVVIGILAAIHAFSSKVKLSVIDRFMSFATTFVGVHLALALFGGAVWLFWKLSSQLQHVALWFGEAIFWFMPTPG